MKPASKVIITGLFFLGLSSLAKADEPYAFDVLKASDVAAVRLPASRLVPSATQPGLPCSAIITVEDAPIRFRVDGTTPTTATGHLANPGDIIKLASNSDLNNFVAISQTSTSTGTLQTSYLRGCK